MRGFCFRKLDGDLSLTIGAIDLWKNDERSNLSLDSKVQTARRKLT